MNYDTNDGFKNYLESRIETLKEEGEKANKLIKSDIDDKPVSFYRTAFFQINIQLLEIENILNDYIDFLKSKSR